MNPAAIEDRIRQIITKVTGIVPETIGPDTSLREDLGLDSLSLLEVGVGIDYEFKLALPDLDQRMAEVKTLGSAVGLVESILRQRSVAATA